MDTRVSIEILLDLFTILGVPYIISTTPNKRLLYFFSFQIRTAAKVDVITTETIIQPVQSLYFIPIATLIVQQLGTIEVLSEMSMTRWLLQSDPCNKEEKNLQFAGRGLAPCSRCAMPRLSNFFYILGRYRPISRFAVIYFSCFFLFNFLCPKRALIIKYTVCSEHFRTCRKLLKRFYICYLNY